MIHKSLQRRTPLRAKTGLKRSPFSRGVKKTLNSTKGRLGCNKTILAGSRPKKKASKSLSKLKKELDSIFSQYIRQKYADDNGYVRCYTCSTVKHWKEMQNGHWIPRNNLATRFSEENCRVQCCACNMFQKERPDVFAVNLVKEGVDIVALEQTKYRVFKIDRFWYESLIEKYKSMIE